MDKSEFGTMAFIPGGPTTYPDILSHFLPPVPEGVVSSWLKKNVAKGAWILDPFGASPLIALEAAEAGYRILVAANNPIVRFLLEMMAQPSDVSEIKAALATLSASFIGDERIEPHISALYETTCARCGQIISADAFLWEHENPAPYAKVYTCPNCGDTGEHPCSESDVALASKFGSSGMHKARALERVVSFNDQDRIHVEQALSVYNSRAIYALITIINKLQGLDLSPTGRKYLEALLLYAFDQASSMWRPQGQSDRRRQLAIPRHSREINVWHALEQGLEKWTAPGVYHPHRPAGVVNWPALPAETGGICIYEGRLAGIINSIKEIPMVAVCTAIPRPNQAFWTLSALWAGWLWGRDAVGSFKSVLHRQRYDWAWHTTALASIFKLLSVNLLPSTKILGLISEAEPGFLVSALVSAATTGCQVRNIAHRPYEKQSQIVWTTEAALEQAPINPQISQAAIQSAKRYLQSLGEPASYLNTFSAALLGIINQQRSAGSENSDQRTSQSDRTITPKEPEIAIEPAPSLQYSNTYNSATDTLSYRSGFLRFNPQDDITFETSTKSQVGQSTLFDQNVGKIIEPQDGSEIPELSSMEAESPGEKDRSTRSSDIAESALLWLREPLVVNQITITDHYEDFLFTYLLTHPESPLSDLDTALCGEFPGLFTPDTDYLPLFLQSYAFQVSPDADQWSIRPEDDPAERQKDIVNINKQIFQIGSSLHFECEDHQSKASHAYISWLDKATQQEYWFFTSYSAAIGEIVLHGELPPTKGFIVFPGSRANLLVYKIRRDPRLSRAFTPSHGMWRFIKFRHLRSLAESPLINRENWEQLFSLDPLTFSNPQLWLI